MSILAKHLAFVNEQTAFHEKMAQKFGPDSFRAKLHVTTADKFKYLASDLESADKSLDVPAREERHTSKSNKPFQLSLSIEDIEGLPDELMQELSLSDGDKTEFAIVNVIEEAGGIISLDKLLIALYKKTGEIHKRNSLYSKLSRMASKNLIYYVPGKKGVYSTEQLTSDDVSRMFGGAKEDGEDLV